MKTLEDEWYIVIKAYKFTIFVILRTCFILSYIARPRYIALHTNSVIVAVPMEYVASFPDLSHFFYSSSCNNFFVLQFVMMSGGHKVDVRVWGPQSTNKSWIISSLSSRLPLSASLLVQTLDATPLSHVKMCYSSCLPLLLSMSTPHVHTMPLICLACFSLLFCFHVLLSTQTEQ